MFCLLLNWCAALFWSCSCFIGVLTHDSWSTTNCHTCLSLFCHCSSFVIVPALLPIVSVIVSHLLVIVPSSSYSESLQDSLSLFRPFLCLFSCPVSSVLSFVLSCVLSVLPSSCFLALSVCSLVLSVLLPPQRCGKPNACGHVL